MPDYFYIYPSYLARGARSDGRRVPVAVARQEPTLESIVEAARSLGFTVEGEGSRQYPRRFQVESGRVKVAKKAGITKARALREIAKALDATTPGPERSH